MSSREVVAFLLFSRLAVEPEPSVVELLFPSVHPTERLLIKVTTLHLSSRAHSGFPTNLLSSTATYAAFFKESRMKFTDETKPDRKSGGRRGTCSAPQLPRKGFRS